MWPSLKNKLKSIESYLKQLALHNDKVLKAIWENDRFLVVYYKKETWNFIKEIDEIFKQLNNHPEVQEKHSKYLKIKRSLNNNFLHYEK